MSLIEATSKHNERIIINLQDVRWIKEKKTSDGDSFIVIEFMNGEQVEAKDVSFDEISQKITNTNK